MIALLSLDSHKRKEQTNTSQQILWSDGVAMLDETHGGAEALRMAVGESGKFHMF